MERKSNLYGAHGSKLAPDKVARLAALEKAREHLDRGSQIVVSLPMKLYDQAVVANAAKLAAAVKAATAPTH